MAATKFPRFTNLKASYKDTVAFMSTATFNPWNSIQCSAPMLGSIAFGEASTSQQQPAGR